VNSELRAFVFSDDSADAYRAGRSFRSLTSAGITAAQLLKPSGWREILRSGGPLLILRAGAWLANPRAFRPPHPSATGKPLCALGATRMPAESDASTGASAAAWRNLLAETGGDFSRSPNPFPLAASLFLDALATRILAEKAVTSLPEVLEIARAEFRLVHFAALDVHDDRGLRLLKVITSLQRGGAERVALDLMAELPAMNTRVRLATLGQAVREAFPAPPGTHNLSAARREMRHTELMRIAINFGADVVHGHLLTADDAQSISSEGMPLVLTVHNTQPGWPAGLADLAANHAALLVACARAVESDLRSAKAAIPIRTVRNGISISEFQPTAERIAAGRRWRRKWGFGEEDFILVAVANPRPQKRLHLLPAILAVLRSKVQQTARHPDAGSPARLVLVGEVLRGNADAEQCLAQTESEIRRLRLEPHVRWTGPIANVAEILAAADVLVSTSAHEGLSLAQIEALAAGCSVVATDVGGAREIAKDHPHFHLVAPDASPELFADVLAARSRRRKEAHDLDLGSSPPPHVGGYGGLSPDWSRQRMAARHRWLYPRAIAAARRSGASRAGLWLLTNNFSTGGAQASARRLLLGLHAQGVLVRAAVIEEDPAFPTPGRRALIEGGVPILALPLDANGQHEAALEQLLAALDADPPQSVLFWNLRPSFKVALADALLDIPVFDVSPGEMLYEAFDKYFEKPNWRFGCGSPREYGPLLAGVIVKYRAEAERAAAYFGAPVHVVPNGVPVLDPESCGDRGQNGAATRLFVFGTAARINPQKRLDDLLEAFHLAHHRLPSYVLKIAGGVERGCGDYATKLRAGCDGLPIQWLDEVTDVGAFYRQLDAFAMISEPAGCPNASLEAMAAGVPIIATDFGGASEQVIDRQTGRLVPARNPRALAEALVEVVTQPELRRNMSLAASQLIRERFSLERMIEDYRRLCL
jgi:glycosyltransferase involved in cell wall biosynthesis